MKYLSKKMVSLLLIGMIAISGILSGTTAHAAETDTTTIPSDTNTSQKVYTIVLDPGHGPAGTGASRDWGDFFVDEAVINFKISQYTKTALEDNYPNVVVYLTKETQNENKAISERVAFAMSKQADVFVSQHVNSTSEKVTEANGVMAMVPYIDETHSYNKDVALLSQKLANKLLNELSLLGFKNNGFLYALSRDNTTYPDGSLADYYGVVRYCRQNNLPGFIMEHGFVNNRQDALLLNDEETLKKIGEADARGIISFLSENLGYVLEPEKEEEPPVHNNPFTDIAEGTYYYDGVLWAVENGITNGIGDNRFGVEQTCTRGQGLTFLWRYEEKPAYTTNAFTFKDVTTNDFFYESVCWGVENKITTGYTAETFAPMDYLTRAQFVTFLWRNAGCPTPTSSTTAFVDISPSDYYYHAVLWAVENGITNGVAEDLFAPNDNCLRVQVVTLLNRLAIIEAENEPEEELPEDIPQETLPEEPKEETPEREPIIIEDPTQPVDATLYGLSVDNEGKENSLVLQQLVDTLAPTGGTIYIPAGEYKFGEIGKQTIGSHCVKMQSNITIKGDGETTILKPYGHTSEGLDMFYFNDYVDTGEPAYLENCHFKDFVIDSVGASCDTYSSAGKGFMINLFKDCTWENITVKNTEGTGFGVDCPIGGSMENCIAINCGKAASSTSPGASGFGIGFGYSEEEYFTISNCKSIDNGVFGFFFEHQGRFNATKYPATKAKEFIVTNCEASNNQYNFGGMLTMNTTYSDCISSNAKVHGFFFENAKDSTITNCQSSEEGNASFVILQSDRFGGTQEVTNILYDGCTSSNTPYGAIIESKITTALMGSNSITNCTFTDNSVHTIMTSGTMDSLTLEGNTSNTDNNALDATITTFINTDNSWNPEEPDAEDIDTEESLIAA